MTFAGSGVVCWFRLPAPGNPEYEALALRERSLGVRQTPVTNSTVEQQRAAAIKDAFTFAFNGYFTTCEGQDELEPVNNTCTNPRNNWGASAVDALSTALVMEIQPIVTEIVNYISTIDYTTTATEVSLFETTIRYMAGMLSGYDLLTGPLSNLSTNASAVDSLLTQSKSLADSLKFAFNTSTGIPSNNLYFTNQSTDGSTTNGLAAIGTLCLEWQRLSDLTNDSSYGDLAQKAEAYLLTPQPYSPFPGLLGTNVNISTGQFVDAIGGWNGGDDSFYEYLIKMYVYDSSRYSNYSARWTLAADSTIQYLTSHPSSRPDLTFLASYDNTIFVNASEHLTCFDGGNFLLGGSVLGRQDYIDFGLTLVDGCHDLYNATLTGIGPETFSWNTTGVNATNSAFYEANGYYITDPIYDLRPEVIESFYYAYRITGNTTYQDWAWDAFVAINATTRVGNGFSEISDVNAPNGGSFENVQESFLFAEVMKYSYLIHAPESIFQVASNGSTNQFVFNTEAHPLKVVGPPV
ncbi:maturation of Asn-linked oligosaccharides protein [Lambiella insularis]|nr:maturation of Asn-linked oligosaccharides protein [Lambiella insularis]